MSTPSQVWKTLSEIRAAVIIAASTGTLPASLSICIAVSGTNSCKPKHQNIHNEICRAAKGTCKHHITVSRFVAPTLQPTSKIVLRHCLTHNTRERPCCERMHSTCGLQKSLVNTQRLKTAFLGPVCEHRSTLSVCKPSLMVTHDHGRSAPGTASWCPGGLLTYHAALAPCCLSSSSSRPDTHRKNMRKSLMKDQKGNLKVAGLFFSMAK